MLKIKNHSLFGIVPHKQIIEGWKNFPESDFTILKACVDESSDIVSLVIKADLENHFPSMEISTDEGKINNLTTFDNYDFNREDA